MVVMAGDIRDANIPADDGSPIEPTHVLSDRTSCLWSAFLSLKRTFNEISTSAWVLLICCLCRERVLHRELGFKPALAGRTDEGVRPELLPCRS